MYMVGAKSGKNKFTKQILKVAEHYNVIVAATMSAGKPP